MIRIVALFLTNLSLYEKLRNRCFSDVEENKIYKIKFIIKIKCF